MAGPSIDLENKSIMHPKAENESFVRLAGTLEEIARVEWLWSVPDRTDPEKREPVARRISLEEIDVPVGLLLREGNPLGMRIEKERAECRRRFQGDEIYTLWNPSPYPFQVEAVEAMLYHSRGVLVAPPRSGKTYVGARVVSELIRQAQSDLDGLRVLWLAPSIETREQAESAFDTVYDKRLRESNARHGGWIQFSCYAALDALRDRDLLETADALVIDEAHHAPAEGLYAVIQACTRARYRLALTATPEGRSDGRDLLLEAAIGPIVYRIDRSALLDEGRTVAAEVEFHLALDRRAITPVTIAEEIKGALDKELPKRIARNRWKIHKQGYTPERLEDEERRRLEFQLAKKYGIAGHGWRNDLIVSEARYFVGYGNSVLILVATKDQGRAIVGKIGVDAAFVCSGMKAAEGNREQIVEQFRRREIHCLVATSLADEGIDLPAANVLIVGCGGRSGLKSEQRSSRVLTAVDDKPYGTVVDFLDVQHPLLESHSWARCKTYKALGYSVRFSADAQAFLDQRKARRGKKAAEGEGDLFAESVTKGE